MFSQFADSRWYGDTVIRREFSENFLQKLNMQIERGESPGETGSFVIKTKMRFLKLLYILPNCHTENTENTEMFCPAKWVSHSFYKN